MRLCQFIFQSAYKKLSDQAYNQTNKLSSLAIKIGLIVPLLIGSALMSMPAQAFDHYAALLSKADAANPKHFSYVGLSSNLNKQASAPCPFGQGIVSCALDKLKLRNLEPLAIDDDYHLLQVIYYPDTNAPKTAVVIATRVGLQDDEINGERFRLSFKLTNYGKPNAQWRFVQYGVQYKCTKTPKNKWVKKGCYSAGNG